MIKKRLRLYLPILVLLFLGVFLLRGLWLDPKKLPSALIGKPAPAVVLPVLSFSGPEAGSVQLTDIQTLQNIDELKGQPWVLNVFASWCQACLVEHPHFIALAKEKKIKLVGLAYKDDIANTRRWLAQYGNPYDMVLVDQQGQYGIELGVYGVPETFLLNANNTIIHKQVGPIPANYFDSMATPAIEASR
ncbi:MAG: DsbE family thiol:disulfide interchange protein [Burkholderiales bacterium]|jgi:cytochrome c biogenesis protein CcmG/thiol:disulfide interchange protein DsbE|uniref:DsbE family thiol:disulfide interchange protein n=1 Tax=Limnobacter sp. TaxID=2003368 RepID=UPI003938F120|nr:DsbE family thiol:disulfide interchange protein [Burkholderiales bacterium]